MGILFLFAFIAGLVTILAPCIWPILPVVLSLTVNGGKRKSLGITLGIILSFGLFTLGISYLLKLIPFDSNIIRYFAVFIIGIFGISFLVPSSADFIEGSLSTFTGKIGIKRIQPRNFTSGFIAGLALGIIWAPCAGPILATIAALAATQKVNLEVVFVTVSYLIGIGIPLFLFATLGNVLFEKSRFINKYIPIIQKAFGVVMIIAAIAILTGYDTKVETNLLSFFPSYTNSLTNIEKNPQVLEQLSELKSGTSNNLGNFGKAPDFIGITKWLNTDTPISIKNLRGKVVLVDFWTYTCINCIRTLPHLTGWYDKYNKDGFVVIGIHTPEFSFEKSTNNVENAINEYNIHYPVGQDNNYSTWNNYNNQYWPAEYLIDAQGNIRHVNFGEGDYVQTENMIRSLLSNTGANLTGSVLALPDETPLKKTTPESYLGYNRLNNLIDDQRVDGGIETFTRSDDLTLNHLSYKGKWDIEGEYAQPMDNASLEFNIYASKVFLVITPGSKSNQISVSVDGKPVGKNIEGSDVENGIVKLNSSRLYNLLDFKGKYENHIIQLDFHTNGTKIYAFTFG